ncbi:MAG: PAS domain S-box protein, partial [Candidatus Brocadiia bacterium]
MKKKGRRPVKSNDLRKRAEDKLKGKTASFKKLAGNDAAKLIHDLEVYQIELEMQNDELRRSQIELEESRHRYSDLYDFAPMGYFVLDKNGIIVEVNLAGAVLVGAERKNLLKKPFALCIGKEYRDGFYLARRKVLQAGVCRRFEMTLLRKGGREFSAELFIEPVKVADGKITQCRLAVIDITTRRKAEDEVKELAKFPEENPFPVLRLSGDGTVLYSNNPGKVLLEQWGTVAGGKAPEDWRMAISRSLKSKKNLVKEIKCGDELFSIVIAPVTDGLCANLYGRNITLLRHKAGLLRKNEQRFKLLSEIAGKLLRSKNPQRLIETLCFKLMEYLDCHTFFNYLVDDEKQCLHLNSYAGIPEETAESVEWLQYDKEICGCVIREGKCFIAENIPETGDPRTDLVKSFGIKAYACHPFIAKGHVIGTLSFGTRTRTTFSKEDLSLMKVVADQLATALDRVRSEEALLESEEKLQSQYAEIESIYNTAVVGLCVFDKDLRYVRINQHMAEMNGLTIEEHIGKTPQEIVPELAPIMQKLGRKVLLTRKPLLDIEFTGRTSANPDEQRYWKQQWLPIKDDDGIVTGINIVAEDIISDRQMEEALRKSRDEL